LSLTLTLNGNIGRSTSSYQREVLRDLALASEECTLETGIKRFLLRYGTGSNPAPTILPIVVAFDQIVVVKFLYVHVTNDAVIRIENSAGATNNKSCDITLGGPEGTLILFPVSVTKLSIISTTTDSTEVEIYMAGN